MRDGDQDIAAVEELRQRIRALESELADSREMVDAIRRGEIDALVVTAREDEHRVYTLETADRPYRVLIEQMQEGAATLGEDGAILYCNQRVATMLGLPQQRVIGRDLREFLIVADAEQVPSMLAQALRIGAQREMTFRAQTGGELPVKLSLSPLRDGETVLYCAVFSDLTEQKQRLREAADINARLVSEIAERERAEDALRQAQKMQAIGQLTGGIAHDFNNMLQGIAGGLELTRRRIGEGRPHEADRFLAGARESVDRAASLTHRLLAFSRRDALSTRRVEVDDALHNIAAIVRQTVGPEIRLEVDLHDGCWPVRCDANQLESALLNLAINGRDSMLPGGGRLRIETAHQVLSARDLAGWSAAEPGEFVCISVIDGGSGMTSDVIARAFEPFFTTKPTGQGTGLGLSQVYGFVSQSGGAVRIESAPGHGTAVRMYLPRETTPLAVEVAAPMRGAVTDPLARHVLLVEDEDNIRTLLAQVLRDLGCTVTEAADGHRALEAAAAGARPEVLISDIGLPGGLNGRQLADAIRQLHPELPVLLITGYAGDAIGPQAPLLPGIRLLRKPFALDDLTQTVRSMLAWEPGASPAALDSGRPVR